VTDGIRTMKVVIRNRLGLHARAAGKFRNLAEQFQAQISVIYGHITVDAKSVLGLMALEASRGTELTLRAEGPDAEQALRALSGLIGQRFGESE